jgi:hypothetical protein
MKILLAFLLLWAPLSQARDVSSKELVKLVGFTLLEISRIDTTSENAFGQKSYILASGLKFRISSLYSSRWGEDVFVFKDAKSKAFRILIAGEVHDAMEVVR